jgi:hypothetical protein
MSTINISIGPGITLNAGITIGNDPLKVTRAELVAADGGSVTADGFTGDGGLWALSAEKIPYWDAIAAASPGGIIDGETWTGHWGPGSTLATTSVVVYYPSFFGANSLVIYTENPSNPGHSLNGTWNMPLRLVKP